MNSDLLMNLADTGSRIVIADEDPGSRHLLNTALTNQGYQVYVVHSIWAVFNILRNRRPDVLFIDPQLASSTGIGMLAAIRTNWRLMPILVLSEMPFSP